MGNLGIYGEMVVEEDDATKPKKEGRQERRRTGTECRGAPATGAPGGKQFAAEGRKRPASFQQNGRPPRAKSPTSSRRCGRLRRHRFWNASLTTTRTASRNLPHMPRTSPAWKINSGHGTRHQGRSGRRRGDDQEEPAGPPPGAGFFTEKERVVSRPTSTTTSSRQERHRSAGTRRQLLSRCAALRRSQAGRPHPANGEKRIDWRVQVKAEARPSSA